MSERRIGYCVLPVFRQNASPLDPEIMYFPSSVTKEAAFLLLTS
ncbi:hypothetical protein CLHUN_10420 [Ruminiclostridium hungatei]|uniref:Uncharacterized protein n=1 Tax=Ruminiclostridium hungatei TaxID=48256 RepID=A0A1V4SNW8_RUMHU|nr:hypothetical protein CLHUN_10420 [Ruminiclostridium hungatei]